MDKCNVSVTGKSFEKFAGEILVFLVAERKDKSPRCDQPLKSLIGSLYRIGDVKGKQGEAIMLYPGQLKGGPQTQAQRILLVGIGAYDKAADMDVRTEALRNAGGTISARANSVKARTIMVVFPSWIKSDASLSATCLTEGLLLGNYRFAKYKKPEDADDTYEGIKKITVQAQGGSYGIAVNKAARRAQAVMAARDMANEPGNKWTPAEFARFAEDLAKESNLKCRVIGKPQMKKLGMGGILAVNQGSATEPKLVILDHCPSKYAKTVLLVGKGITFDSGGVSLKPAANMQDMKYDMCGGAAVIATMQSIAVEKPNTRIVAIVPATDNMPGGSALKPGDIVTHYGGVTAEIINTDAEGRLILADALAYGIDTYKPDCVIDFATLTGAVIIGLGHHRAGLMTNSDQLADALFQAADRSGEYVWRLPLDKEYVDLIDSDVADIKNSGGRPAGTITAAAYLKKFVGDTPWAHIDIAGTAWEYTQKSYIPKGASGFGVRLLLSFIDNVKQLKLRKER